VKIEKFYMNAKFSLFPCGIYLGRKVQLSWPFGGVARSSKMLREKRGSNNIKNLNIFDNFIQKEIFYQLIPEANKILSIFQFYIYSMKHREFYEIKYWPLLPNASRIRVKKQISMLHRNSHEINQEHISVKPLCQW
jgi:hypothetical protein